MIIAVTHGSKHTGANPSLTDAGREEIAALREKLFWPFDQALIGTGRRFHETFEVAGPDIESDAEIRYSPLLGSADSGDKSESGSMTLFLACGRKIGGVESYVGLIGTPGVDLWKWLRSLNQDGPDPDSIFLATGREFIGALMEGTNQKAESATAYSIDPETRTVTKL